MESMIDWVDDNNGIIPSNWLKRPLWIDYASGVAQAIDPRSLASPSIHIQRKMNGIATWFEQVISLVVVLRTPFLDQNFSSTGKYPGIYEKTGMYKVPVY